MNSTPPYSEEFDGYTGGSSTRCMRCTTSDKKAISLTDTIVSSLRQRPHHALKRHERHRIRRKSPQKARHETPPIPLPSRLSIHRLRRVSPPREPAASAKWVRHDSLFDNVARIGCDPKDLCGEAARPEVDGWWGQVGVVLEVAGKDIVAAPPETEEGAEEERCAQAVVDAAHAMAVILEGR